MQVNPDAKREPADRVKRATERRCLQCGELLRDREKANASEQTLCTDCAFDAPCTD